MKNIKQNKPTSIVSLDKNGMKNNKKQSKNNEIVLPKNKPTSIASSKQTNMQEIKNQRKNNDVNFSDNNEPKNENPMPANGGKFAKQMAKPKNFKKSLKDLTKYLRPYWLAIVTALLFAAVGVTLSIIGPKVLIKITEEIIKGIIPGFEINFSKIATIGLWLSFIYIISAVLTFMESYIMSGVTAKISKNLRQEISQKINKLPLSYFDKNSYGDILSRVTNDVDTLSSSLNQALTSFIYSITSVIGIIIMMLTISVNLTLIALVSVPLSMILVAVIVKFSQKHFKKQQQLLGTLNGYVEEIYTNHNIVKVFNGEENAVKNFDEINNNLYASGYKTQFFSGLMMPIMQFVGNLGYVLICVVGAQISLKNPLFIASIIAFIQYIKRFNQPIAELSSVAGTMQSTIASAERVFEFLNETEQENENELNFNTTKPKGSVEFKKVSFGYDKNKTVIKNFNLKVEPGQKIAIVGPTGAGKTTLVNLLMKFYNISKGDILIDGVSIHKLTRQKIRHHFSMVLQDAWLFEGTILENLKFGNQNATFDEVVNACKNSEIDHFIKTLPNSYELELNEETTLSQGQKQLLTIARAMVQNAPMLILDEATSSVDTRTEELIQKAMDRLMKGKTSFVIAHRLSTIKNADIILVIKDGSIVEQGNHKQLIKQKGFYHELYNSQFSKNYDEV